MCPSEWLKWDLWSSGDSTFAVRSAPGMKWALLSDGGSVSDVVKAVWVTNWVLKPMKSVHCSHCLCFHSIFFDLWSFFHSLFVPSELGCCSLLYSGTLVNQSAFGRCLHHLLTAMRGQDFEGLHRSASGLGENASTHNCATLNFGISFSTRLE